MSKGKASETVQAAQDALKRDVLAALRAFTDQTGLIVPGMDWHVAVALDSDGNLEAADYYATSLSLSTGVDL